MIGTPAYPPVNTDLDIEAQIDADLDKMTELDPVLDPNFLSKVADLVAINANPVNWAWPDDARRSWTKAPSQWQAFTTKWHNATEAEIHSVDGHGFSVLDFGFSVPEEFAIPRVLIRDCHREACTRIWSKAFYHRETGVILTGQPGIGKTIFIWYLLVCLLQKKQVVLFHLPGTGPFLFYHDQSWQKERNPLLTGFSLWSRDELARGIRLHVAYPSFMKELHKITSVWKRSPVKFPYPGILELLKQCFRYDPPASADVAFEALLDVVIEHVGYAPQEVFPAVFNFNHRMGYCDSAFSIGYNEFQHTVQAVAFFKPRADIDVSRRAICLHLQSKIGDIARWRIDFRSSYIAKRMVQRLSEEGENRVREMITSFSSLPHGKGTSLAGWFFEPLAHQAIISTATDPAVHPSNWSFQKMTFQYHESPSFVLSGSSQSSDGFLKTIREPVFFESADVPTHLENDKYYIPQASNLAFFDSFVVQLNASQGSAELWLLQMTISDHHRGSSMGLLLVRKMIQTLRQQLISHSGGPPQLKQRIAPEVNVNVHYVLVHPKGEAILQSKWTLPKGWNEHAIQADHRGDGYVLEVPALIRNTLQSSIE